MLKSILLVAIGGALGSVMRYFTSLVVKHYFSGSFPLATFIANMAGCLLIGLLSGVALKHQWAANPNFTLLLITGFCGGYTTFSAFALENLTLLQSNNFFTAIGYTVLSVFAGIACVWLGILLTK
ncbi:MAG: fluoride efflux transporter CrcB [Flavobacterium sp.]